MEEVTTTHKILTEKHKGMGMSISGVGVQCEPCTATIS